MDTDILKLLVVLVAFFYLNSIVKREADNRNFWIMNIGLLLLLFASVLDYTDGIMSMDYVPVLGNKAAFHDVLEDQFGDTPGIALFAFGAFREILRKRNKQVS